MKEKLTREEAIQILNDFKRAREIIDGDNPGWWNETLFPDSIKEFYDMKYEDEGGYFWDAELLLKHLFGIKDKELKK